jgi:phosphatidate cytidylyltransferase
LKNLITRTLTGIVFVAVIVAAILIHPLLFGAVFGIVIVLMITEFYTLSGFEGKAWIRYLGTLAGMYLFFATLLYAGKFFGSIIFLPYLLALIVLLVAQLYQKNVNPVNQWGIILFSQIYCAGSLSLLCFIPYWNHQSYNPLLLLTIFVFIWLNDTAAYLVGTWKGRHRLFKRISPLKSWEGLWGGFVVVLIVSQIFAQYFTLLTWYEWLLFAVVTVVAATFGDLMESLLKRTYGVKDSGNILPGHGGVLDRFDSVILVAPSVFILLEILLKV